MPEFEQRKRKTMSEKELYEEYHYGENTPRKSSAAKKKNGSSAHKNALIGSKAGKTVPSKGSYRRENPPISAERKKRNEDLKKKQTAAKKSKTYTGKTTGRAARKTSPSSKKGSGRPYSDSMSRSSSSSSSSRSHGGQKRRTGKYTLYYVLIGILAVAVLTILSTTVLFNIGIITVEGESSYSDEEIIEACGIRLGENLLRIDTEKGEKNIVSKLVYIESAEIHRSFPNRLTLSVEPAKTTAAFAYGGKYYIISEQKRLLDISDTRPDCPVIKGVQIIMQPKEQKGETTAQTADGNGTVGETETLPSVPTAKEGITLENDAEEIAVGVVMGDDNNDRIKLALSVVALMADNGLTKKYELNIANVLDLNISYDEHIEIDLGTSAQLDEKIYHARRIIEEDVGENEKCTLNLTNPLRGVKRPIYETAATEAPVTEPENTSGEETQAPEG